MIKVILVTHGPLAEALKECSTMFFSEKSEELYTVGLFPEDSPNDLLTKIKTIVEKDSKEEYLFLVDIFGGTPFNMVALLMEEYSNLNIQCLTGVNMPLLMEVMSSYETVSLDDLLISLENIAANSIINLRKSFGI